MVERRGRERKKVALRMENRKKSMGTTDRERERAIRGGKIQADKRATDLEYIPRDAAAYYSFIFRVKIELDRIYRRSHLRYLSRFASLVFHALLN